MTLDIFVKEAEITGASHLMVRGNDGLPSSPVDYIWVPRSEPCIICRRVTTWRELNFEAPLCPGECTEALWDEFDEANRVQARRYANAMQCPNKACNPPNFCGLCKGTGEIPD